MRIIFVQQDTCLYGASRSLLALIEQLSQRGHSCFVLVPKEDRLTTEFKVRNIPHSIIPWRGWVAVDHFSQTRRFLSGAKGVALNLRLLSSAARICQQFKPDVIHTNSSKTAFGSVLARKLGVPHTWHFREFLGGECGCGLTLSFGNHLSGSWLRRSTSMVVFISDTLRQYFKSRLNNVKSQVVYNGVMSIHEMQDLNSFPLPDPLTLALVGRLDPLKQPLVALKGVEKVLGQGANVQLLIAGGGEYKDVKRVADYIADHNLASHIKLLGEVRDIRNIYVESHALVICSKGEAFGRVTAEAMAYGRLVIGADAGATSELVKHGCDGLLFRAGDSHDLADKICYLIENKDLVGSMGANAAKNAKQKFTTEKYAESMERIFLNAGA
ncbi:MAG: hypothetical protein CEE38_05015 [Planctomycetes bacterium B3_Pla]|nr:MAG: hypothetical protein CEE38_05015 [Planctomycetes bacterium B3_Pla]